MANVFRADWSRVRWLDETTLETLPNDRRFECLLKVGIANAVPRDPERAIGNDLERYFWANRLRLRDTCCFNVSHEK